MSRELARAANDRIHGSLDSKHGKRYECVDWHEKNFDCKPWQEASGSEGYGEAMTDFTKAIAKSVGKWINDDPEMKQLLQRIATAKHGLFDSNSRGSVHNLPWTDFDICNHQGNDMSMEEYDECMELLTKEVDL